MKERIWPIFDKLCLPLLQRVGRTMYVGTGDCPVITLFYKNSGFVFSHRVENYFVEHYDKPMFENGVQLTDKIYLKRVLY